MLYINIWVKCNHWIVGSNPTSGADIFDICGVIKKDHMANHVI